MGILITRVTSISGAGYISIDETAAGKGHREADIYCCSHCQAVIFVKAWREDGGFCGRCQAPVCGPCADRMQTRGCEPFTAQVERMLEEVYRREQNAKILGI